MIIADWRILEKYQPDEGRTMRLWGWEFLRRNYDYQKDWDNIAAHYPAKAISGYWDENIEFSVAGDGKSLEKWHIEKYYNPTWDRPWRLIYDSPPKVIVGPEHPFFDIYGARVSIGEDEFAIIIDVNKSIKAQLNDIRSFLQHHVKSRGISVKSKPQKPKTNWLEYLRLIDAQAANLAGEKSAARKYAASKILQNVKNRDKEQRLLSAWESRLKQANKMVEKGYKKLLLAQEP